MFWTFIAVATDTAFYTGPAATESFRALFSYLDKAPVITPLNNIRYNSQTSNLAEHGLHPHYQHFLVNLPQRLEQPAPHLSHHLNRHPQHHPPPRTAFPSPLRPPPPNLLPPASLPAPPYRILDDLAPLQHSPIDSHGRLSPRWHNPFRSLVDQSHPTRSQRHKQQRTQHRSLLLENLPPTHLPTRLTTALPPTFKPEPEHINGPTHGHATIRVGLHADAAFPYVRSWTYGLPFTPPGAYRSIGGGASLCMATPI